MQLPLSLPSACDNVQHSMTIKGQQLHGRAINIGLKGAQFHTNLEWKGTQLFSNQQVMTTFHPNNPPCGKGIMHQMLSKHLHAHICNTQGLLHVTFVTLSLNGDA